MKEGIFDTTTLLLIMNVGALLLASIYHTILFIHRQEQLLLRYCIYLWSACGYVGFRLLTWPSALNYVVYDIIEFPADEILQMVAFYLYVTFLMYSLEISRKDGKIAAFFKQYYKPVILSYLCLFVVLLNTFSGNYALIAYILVRIYLLIFGLVVLYVVMRRRKSPYYLYLGAGALVMIVVGIFSSIAKITNGQLWGLAPFAWLQIGFFTDVVFFSAAIGYRIKLESTQKENALQTIVEQQNAIQQKELEKLDAIYSTREQERLRIASDLHDELGSTLSSIQILSKVAENYVGKDEERTAHYLNRIQNDSTAIMEQVSDLIWSLQTGKKGLKNLWDKIVGHAREVLGDSDIQAHTTFKCSEFTLQVFATKHIWLLAKEAINNTCKYSKARNCYIALTTTATHATLSIADDGTGFDLTQVSGNGLKNMASRAEQLHARISIQSNQKTGTIIEVIFAIPEIRDLATTNL